MPEIYRNPHVGTMADLIRQRGQIAADQARAVGEAQAQRAAVSGQAWGNAIQNIGQTVSGTLRDYAQAPQRAAQAAEAEEAAFTKAAGREALRIQAFGYTPEAVMPFFKRMAQRYPEHGPSFERALQDPTTTKAVIDGLVAQLTGQKPEKPEVTSVDTVDDAGNQVTRFVEKVPGQSFAKPSEKVGTVSVQTVENGVPVTKIVPNTAGQSFPTPPAEKTPQYKPERVDVLLDGKPQTVVWNPNTERYTLNGVDVSQRVRPIPPQGPAPEKPGVWVSKGTEQRYVTPSEAASLTAQGWGPSQTRENPTEDERKTAGFYNRMTDAVKTMDEVEDQLTASDLYQIQSLPQEDLIGAINRGKMSEAAKRYVRAMTQFTEARLRADSGAAISAGEYASDRQVYAKQYGETPELNVDRRRARRVAIEGIKTRAGRAMPKPVIMVAPDGTEQAVDPSEVEHYRARGARVKG